LSAWKFNVTKRVKGIYHTSTFNATMAGNFRVAQVVKLR
jgi:hypothetical protein